MSRATSTSSKLALTFQDALQIVVRYVKYWKIIVLFLLFGLSSATLYLEYGKRGYYSRSLVAFNDLFSPIRSEASEVTGAGRWAQLRLVLQSALNSRWLVEQTASRFGLVSEPGQYEYIREKFVSKIRVSPLPGNLFQIEVYGYYPWVVRAWPEAMLAAYQDYTLNQKRKHRDSAMEAYAEEMENLKKQMHSDRNDVAKFEEDNKIIEQYISNNSLEQVPSELLSLKTRMETMDQVLGLIGNDAMSPVERLSVIKRFRGKPVPVGTIMRRSLPDNLVQVAAPTQSGLVLGLTSDSQVISAPSVAPSPVPGAASAPVVPAQPQVVVVPSMVEELEPWEKTERLLREAQQEHEHLSKTLLPGHELMRNLDKKIQQLELALASEFSIAVESFKLEREHLNERFAELQRKMPDYRKVLNDFDKFKQDYNLMTSGRVFWEAAYSNLKQKISAMEYTGVELKSDLEFQGFTMMRDQDPVSPDKKTLFIYGALLGMAMAGGVAFALERFRSSTSMVSDAEAITGLHALGVVPLSKSPDDFRRLFMLDDRDKNAGHDLHESFRIVRCSLPLHVGRDNKCQVILVTSARPGEGKTVASSILSRSFAEAGHRTLLIDADLRRGRIEQLLGATKPGGLRSFLEGDVKNFDDIVNNAPGERLDVVVRGGYSIGSVEALGQTKFSKLIEELRGKYDRIVIDTPPILGLADSLMIAPSTDGVLLVIRADKTTQRDILTGIEQISSTKVPIYGFLLNGVDLSRVENYYYYSSYYPKYYDPGYDYAEA
jgi:succinoglycan biosynthesis transport protein ExoP